MAPRTGETARVQGQRPTRGRARWASRRAILGLAIGVGGLVGGMGGCEYAVEIRNATQRPVSVQMIQRNLDGWQWLMDSDRIPPGQVVTLGPSGAFLSTVTLELDATDEDAFGTQTRLRPGRTLFDVRERLEGNAVVFRLERRDRADRARAQEGKMPDKPAPGGEARADEREPADRT